MPTYPFPTTNLVAAPEQSSFPAGTNLLVVTPAGVVGQTPQNLLPAAFFNVKATFGAVGSGVSDDRTAIVAAIAAASSAGSGTVFFPPGTYLTSGAISVPSNVRLLGDGATIKANSSSLGTMLRLTGSNSTIENLTIDGAFSGSSGSTITTWGLIDLACSSSTPFSNNKIVGCTVKNSAAIGIRPVDHIDKLVIRGCWLANNFCSVFFQTTLGGGYSNANCEVTNCVFWDNWGTGAQSGACKVQGDYTTGNGPVNFTFQGNKVTNCGEMGCEIWKNGFHCAVRGNNIGQVEFGVSIDAGSHVLVADNVIWQNSYTGVEFAVGCTFCTARGNEIYEYVSGARAGNHGIVSSGGSCTDCVYQGNTIRGANASGIELQGSARATIIGNTISDCAQLIYSKASDHVVAKGNQLDGPCGYHVFLDYNDRSGTNVQISGNTFTGLAASDNIIVYDNAHGNSLTNLSITENDASAATYTNLSINIQISTPNLQIDGNLYTVGVAGAAQFSATASNYEFVPPFSSAMHRGGLTVSTKRVIALSASSSARWIKLVSYSLGSSFLQRLHVTAFNTSKSLNNEVSAIITAAPYNQSSVVEVLPGARYFPGVVDQVIYNNPTDSATHEVWLKLLPTPSDAITLECHFSDYPTGVIVSPTATTSAPTLAANSYSVSVYEQDTPSARQAGALITRSFIASCSRGAVANPQARIYARGAAPTGSPGNTRIMRLDLDDGTEAVGTDQNGQLLVNKKLSIGGGAACAAMLMGEGNVDYGTALAGAEISVGVGVGGARTGSKPVCIADFDTAIPTGVEFKQARVTANDIVTVTFRNNTGSDIAVGTLSTRIVVLHFA